jgi:uncharacterized membrane protein HdeD (DUF308 family)
MAPSMFFTDFGERARNVRGWIVFAGIAALALGALAIVYDNTSTIASVLVFAWLLMFVGAIQIVTAFQVRTWSGFFLYLLDGIIRAVVGTLMVMYPTSGAQALTLVLSFYFIVGGLFKTFGSIALQFPSWGWSVASSLISLLLGVMLAVQWPSASTWFIGFAVGLDLIIYGWALLAFAAAVKKLIPATA